MQELMNITVGKQLEQVAQRFPDRECLKYTDRDYRRTWQEFNAEAERIARGFMAAGIGKGDHVAIGLSPSLPLPKSAQCW